MAVTKFRGDVETKTMLVLCNSHVTRATAEWLNGLDDDDWTWPGGRWLYGWFMWCAAENGFDILQEAGCPDYSLWTCWQYAKARGFEYIMLDRDVAPTNALLVHEW